jgi:hypothetical protein
MSIFHATPHSVTAVKPKEGQYLSLDSLMCFLFGGGGTENVFEVVSWTKPASVGR